MDDKATGFLIGVITCVTIYALVIIGSKIGECEYHQRLEIKYHSDKPYDREIVKELLNSYQITNRFDIITYHMDKFNYNVQFLRKESTK